MQDVIILSPRSLLIRVQRTTTQLFFHEKKSGSMIYSSSCRSVGWKIKLEHSFNQLNYYCGVSGVDAILKGF
jgi:hypothetical protein